MGCVSFICLLVIGVVVAVILERVPKLKIKLPGGTPTALIVGYLGARLGAWAFGNWPFLTCGGISILPAILGAIVGLLLAKAAAECCKK